MSGQTTKTVGEILYLEAQLYDEEENLPLRIIADILDKDGALITTIEPLHTSKGVFVDATYAMPNEPVLYVKYYVFETDGITPKTNDYGIIGEKFVLTTNIISTTIVTSESVTGELGAEEELIGTLGEDELAGTLSEEENLEGTTSDDILTGEVICE